jgi:hypothetical protein
MQVLVNAQARFLDLATALVLESSVMLPVSPKGLKSSTCLASTRHCVNLQLTLQHVYVDAAGASQCPG